VLVQPAANVESSHRNRVFADRFLLDRVMDIEGSIELVYETAQGTSTDSDTCRDFLLSLWEDGVSHGCDMSHLMTLDKDAYEAIIRVLNHFFHTRQQLSSFLSTKQISALTEPPKPDEKAQPNQGADSVFILDDAFSRVKRF
jgi:hypothetical protein